MWGRLSSRQYSSANMIVSTRLTTGSPFAFLTSGSSYKSIFACNRGSVRSEDDADKGDKRNGLIKI